MEVFELIVDEKLSVWKRSFVTISANTLEEAVDFCIKEGIDGSEIIESEYLDDTAEYIIRDEVSNPITIEVMDTHYNSLGSDLSSK